MQVRFIFSDEVSASLELDPSETVASANQRLLVVANKTSSNAHWMFLGIPLHPNSVISDTALADGCTVNVFLRGTAAEGDSLPQFPSDYSSKTDQILLRILFAASFIIFAAASFARTKYPEAFTTFSTVALNSFWTLWAIALASNWRSLGDYFLLSFKKP